MEYVGRKVKKEVRGCASFGAVEVYLPATGLFKVVYDGGDSEEMELAEVSPLLAAAAEGSSIGAVEEGNRRNFDLNSCGDDCSGSLHGLDLNEGVNYILHEGLDSDIGVPKGSSISGVKRNWIDLNLEPTEEEVEISRSLKRVKWFDLNVELKEEEAEEVGDKGKAIVEQTTSTSASAARRRRRAALSASRSFVEPAVPPKVELPSSSCSLDIHGASLLDFLSVHAFLRSFSASILFLSPFQVDDFAVSLKCNESTLLFDSIHLSLLKALRPHLKSLSDQGSVSAHACLRYLNWDFLDTITWPMFLVEYLLFHTPKCIPGLNLHEFEEFQNDYYRMPTAAKVSILRYLCDDLIESEGCRSELKTRAEMEEKKDWKMGFFNSEGREYEKEMIEDGNGYECYLCKMDGKLICCDTCPAAFHSRCVGVVNTLLPDGDWHCPECTIHKSPNTIRGTQLLGSDPHGRHYYATCNYLLVSDSCDEEYSFLVYNGSDIPAVIVALESSSSFHHAKIISAIRMHWNSTHGEAANGASSSQDYVNSYEFGGMAFSMSKELTSEDGIRSAQQIIARQLRVIRTSDKSATFSLSNIRNLNYGKEKCGWCFCCKDERECLFLRNEGIQASENFTCEVLGIQSRDGDKKKHLIDVICHVMWIENRLQGLFSRPHNSKTWRSNAVEAAHVASLNKLLLQVS